ncbi:hypothetical protein TTHERM_00149360 (macronuclear) [Tetrahymena thermophila SB210]|uniref:Uncharacterized protein n=1 Tax=Tetrahymena thermophila (strain SB210) TaxID=312017 RepID=I7M2U6_TETTS|nr:hypothetical protein TTHERM_00149360 [Tetrahymena thermophila SB210]EAS01326.2 hypothetical protein TTHERM_00149360 [Tetrahymena thermophila SB210]|eukprot:XP_001021571.2 hypothetical protein TTHERM_00149360 [Tetrahymena thermophila SB210]
MSKIPVQLLDRLELNIKFAIDDIQKEKRQYINKHIQNSLNNYFLENYCVLDLKKKFEIYSGRQIKNLIQEKYSFASQFNSLNLNFATDQHSSLKKYYILLLGFLEEHVANGTLEIYREAMLKILNEETPSYSESEISIDHSQEWISPFIFYNNDSDKINKWVQLQWKKLIALFVLHHSYYPKIEAIYQIWFDIFQNRIVDASTQKKKKPENNRPYKYQGLPYVSNSDFYSSQPLVVPKNDEISQAQQKKLKLFKSQKLRSQDQENGTQQENKEQKESEQMLKQTKYRITLINQKTQQALGELDNSSMGENNDMKRAKKEQSFRKEYETQNISDSQVIEKKPYKKLKQDSDLPLKAADSSNNSLNSMVSIQLIQNNNNPQAMKSACQQKDSKDYRNIQVICQQSIIKEDNDIHLSSQNFKQSKKVQTNTLSKDYFPQQAQSAFSKYNKKVPFSNQQQAKQIIDSNTSEEKIVIKKESNQVKQETNNSLSPKAVISIISPNNLQDSQNTTNQDIPSKQFIKNEDYDSSNCLQEKQNEQSTCDHSQNILQSPISQAPQITFSTIPVNSFQYQVGSIINPQPTAALHYSQQPLQVMFQQFLPHQQINQFIHPNQISSSQQVIPLINVNNIPIVHVPINYISMIQPNCAPTTAAFVNIQKF